MEQKSGANCGYRDGESSSRRRLDENVSENTPRPFSSVVLGDVEEALSLSDPSCTTMTTSFVTMPPLSLFDALGAEAVDPFNTLPIEMSHGSKLLLDHCGYPFFKSSFRRPENTTRYFFGVLTSMLADRLR
jgi:hypothetical protein